MSKIFSVEQLKRWDAFTIREKPIASIDLMEAAATTCAEYLNKVLNLSETIAIFCGPGNNGGDGLAIARLLQHMGYTVSVFLMPLKNKTPEFETNLKRFLKNGEVVYLSEKDPLREINASVVIDAIFGVGLNRPATGYYKIVIEQINGLRESGVKVFSVDVPSGLFAERSSSGNPAVHASVTMTFGSEKLAFFMPENGTFTGEVETLDIGLSGSFYDAEETVYETIDMTEVSRLIKKRKEFSNKGDYGNACLIAGSYGMMGAAVLASVGCLRSGAGKLTCYTCEKGYGIMQTAVPEAMCRTAGGDFIADVTGLENYNAIGIGPGIGRMKSHVHLLEEVFKHNRPVVIDADALNVLSEHKELLSKLPTGSILTPHPKEFERLFGKSADDFEERNLAIQMATAHKIFVVLKGRYTCIATPSGRIYMNTTGNPGMATGGSGDVLAGILTGLLAQHYDSLATCILGVYLHGLAGDLAAQTLSQNALIASDIYEYLGRAFLKIMPGAN